MDYRKVLLGLAFASGLFYGRALGLEGKVTAQDTSKPKQEQVVEQFNFVSVRDSVESINKQLLKKYGHDVIGDDPLFSKRDSLVKYIGNVFNFEINDPHPYIQKNGNDLMINYGREISGVYTNFTIKINAKKAEISKTSNGKTTKDTYLLNKF